MAGQQKERAEVVKDFVGMDYKGEAGFDFEAANKRVMPINALTPFAGAKWMVKARVVEKQPVRRWRNAKGTGLVTNVTIIDETGTAIRATLFNDGVEKYYRMLQVGKVFYFGPSTRGQGNSVRGANKQFSALSHDYELALDDSSPVQPVQAHDVSVQKIAMGTTANFLRFSELANRAANTTTDVRGIVLELGQVTQHIQKSTGQPIQRRVVKLCDDSGLNGSQADLTLFEDAAKLPPSVKTGTTVVARGMRVAHYKGTASLTAPREIEIKWGEECDDLTKWWENQGKGAAMKGLLTNVSQMADSGAKSEYKGSFRLGLSAIEEQKMGLGERPDYINIRATIMGFPEKEDRQLWYDACPIMVDDAVSGKRMCGKKIENFVPGSKCHCQKCDTDIDRVSVRFIAGVRVGDHTTERWATCFDEAGNDLFGCPAESLKGNPERLDQLKKQLTGNPVTMTLKVKERVTPDGNMRMESQCVRVRTIRSARDWAVDCRNMLTDLERYSVGEASQLQMP